MEQHQSDRKAEESFADTYNGLLGMAKKAGFNSVGDAIRAAAKAEAAVAAPIASNAEPGLEQLKALALAATPGPWANGYGTGVSGGRAAASCLWDCADVQSVPIRKGNEIIAWVAAFDPSDEEARKMGADAAFIARASPAVVLDLIALIETERENAKAWQRHAEREGQARIERAASPATASGDELPPLPKPDFMSGDFTIGESAYTDVQMRDYARAAVSAATNPTADLRKLTVYEFSAFEDGSRQQYALLTDVQSLLATKPAAAQAVPEGWRATLEQMAGWLDSSARIVQNGPDDYGPATQFDYELGQAAAEIRSLLAASPMASTDAVVEAREQAFEDAAARCESAELLFDLDELMHRTKKELTAITANKLAEEIRALKRTKAAGAEGAE